MALTYTTPNNRCGGGRFIYPNAVLDLIAAAPEGGWVQLNTNRFDSAIAPLDYRPTFGLINAVIGAWSSIAWDSKRNRFYLFGGGHANSNDSGVYYWDAFTRQWALGFYSPEDMETSLGRRSTKDGPLISPVSAHTYGNNNYLPILDRFISFGGAAHNSGGSWEASEDPVRLAYGYLMQLDAVGLGYVSGLTGNNFNRSGTAEPKIGARAWTCLDYRETNNPDWPVYGTVQGMAFVVDDDGVDVVYQVSNTNTTLRIERIAMPSANPATHTYSRVGRRQSGLMTGDHSAALDYDSNVIVLHNRGAPFAFCDLKLASPTNDFKYPTGMSGTDYDDLASIMSNTRSGMASDPIRKTPFIYAWGKKVFKVNVPAGNPTPLEGWSIEQVADTSGDGPLTRDEGNAISGEWSLGMGVYGKWRYCESLDCYLTVQLTGAGNVWAWKPPQWRDPRVN